MFHNNTITDLINIANVLDDKGLIKEADYIDALLKSAAERERAVEQFIADLKRALTNAAQSPKHFPTIHKALPEVLKVIDVLSEHRAYLNPTISEQTLESMKGPVSQLVDMIVAGEENILDVQRQLKEAKDPTAINALQLEQQGLTKEVKARWDEVAKLNDIDRAAFTKMLDTKKRQRISESYKG